MSIPDLVVGMSATTPDFIDAQIAPQRQCGRCRGFFALETPLDPRALREWWACPACRAALFPPKFGPRERQSA